MKDRSTFKIRVETIIGIEIRITPGNRIWFIPIQCPEDTNQGGDSRVEVECGCRCGTVGGLRQERPCPAVGQKASWSLSDALSRCPVSAATRVGALPSRETALFTTASWVAGKKSKWQSGDSGAGGKRWGWGPPCLGAGGSSAVPLAPGLCALQAGGCGWWAARDPAAAAWRLCTPGAGAPCATMIGISRMRAWPAVRPDAGQPWAPRASVTSATAAAPFCWTTWAAPARRSA